MTEYDPQQAKKYWIMANAAEDLLKALESILPEFINDKVDQEMCADPHTLGRINQARAAIAKAHSQ